MMFSDRKSRHDTISVTWSVSSPHCSALCTITSFLEQTSLVSPFRPFYHFKCVHTVWWPARRQFHWEPEACWNEDAELSRTSVLFYRSFLMAILHQPHPGHLEHGMCLSNGPDIPDILHVKSFLHFLQDHSLRWSTWGTSDSSSSFFFPVTQDKFSNSKSNFIVILAQKL